MPEVGEPELDEPAEPDGLEQPVDEAVGLEDLEEDDGRDRLGEDVRREEDQPQEAPAAQRAVEEQRDAERERELQEDRERDEDHVVPHRLAEDRVAEGLAVVVEPDEVGQRARARSRRRRCSGPPGRPGRAGRGRRARARARGRARSRRHLPPGATRRPAAHPRGRPSCVAGRHCSPAYFFFAASAICVDDLLRRRLARELVRDRGVERLPDRLPSTRCRGRAG